jgi:hypothetical protein
VKSGLSFPDIPWFIGYGRLGEVHDSLIFTEKLENLSIYKKFINFEKRQKKALSF